MTLTWKDFALLLICCVPKFFDEYSVATNDCLKTEKVSFFYMYTTEKKVHWLMHTNKGDSFDVSFLSFDVAKEYLSRWMLLIGLDSLLVLSTDAKESLLLWCVLDPIVRVLLIINWEKPC